MAFNFFRRMMPMGGSMPDDSKIDAYISAEQKAGKEIGQSVREELHKLRDIKHMEKKLRGVERTLESAAIKKKNLEMRAEVGIRKARMANDLSAELSWKRWLYRKLAKRSMATYRELMGVLDQIRDLPNFEKSFEETNNKVRGEIVSLMSGIRQEVQEEQRKAA